ncbi:MAG: SIS domain-containing protein [Halioglobus sp.]|nr:SIS domain-containing protein [Halioglobus sp.]MCB1706036.1 SIS domain-containing protein [Halioglobus sp.]
MDYYPIIADSFQNTIETIAMSVDDLAGAIAAGSQLMTGALLADRKIIVCGNGVDAAVAQLFACNLLGRFEQDRPALPALSLAADNASVTAIAQSGAFNDIFSRQLRALGQAGDVLLCISSGEGASNLLRAVQTAQERDMAVIAMTSTRDSTLSAVIRPEDVELRVNAMRQARVVEMHTMAIHSFCALIDHSLFGSHDLE